MYVHAWVRATDDHACFGCKRSFDPKEIAFTVFDEPAGVFALFCFDCVARWCRTGESPFRGVCPHCRQERPLHWRHDGPNGLDRGCRLCLWPMTVKPPVAHYDLCSVCRHPRLTVKVELLDGQDLCMECLIRLAQGDIDAARRRLGLLSLFDEVE